MNKRLYVGNLLFEVTDEDLKNQFSTIGPVSSAVVIKFRESGRSKGFGFVEMETEEDAKAAIEAFHQKDFRGRTIVVSEAKPPKEKTEIT